MEWRLWERVDTLANSVTAANQRHNQRHHLFVEVVTDDGCGWGEVTPIEQPHGGDPGVDEVRLELINDALANVVSLTQREGALPSWSRVHLHARRSAPSTWAYAAIEMALLDLELVRDDMSLSQFWKSSPELVPLMATTSLLTFDPEWQPPSAAQRVRLKTAPGVTLDSLVAIIATWGVPVLLDFNGSADSYETIRDQVATLRSCVEVVAVEQPFPPGDLASHTTLARSLDVAISLDEGVRTVLDVRRIVRYEAASLVCVKPPRAGGVAAARSMLTEAAKLGLRTYVGGFFESTLARSVHAAVAGSFDVEPSDVGEVAFGNTMNSDVRRSTGVGIYPASEDLTLVHVVGTN